MPTGARRPLGRIVALRIVLFAALAMLAQLVAVLVEYGSDPEYLSCSRWSRRPTRSPPG